LPEAEWEVTMVRTVVTMVLVGLTDVAVLEAFSVEVEGGEETGLRGLGRKTNKQTSKQANKQTSKQANKQTSKQANKHTSKQANKQTSKQADKK